MGRDATTGVLEASPASAVLVLSMLDDDASVAAAVRAGAHGYRNHPCNIMTELGTSCRAQLIVTARSAELGEVP